MAELCESIRTRCVQHRVYGNGLLNVHIFAHIYGFDGPYTFHKVYLNVEGSSVRHFIVRKRDTGEVVDPTVFPGSIENATISDTPENDVSIDFTETLRPHFREDLFDHTMATRSTEVFWRLCRDTTFLVFRDVLQDVGLIGTIPFLTRKKIPHGFACPCGSTKKYNACHMSLWF
jgi:hypothetical protein